MFRIRPGSGEPIYEQLMRQVKHGIISGALVPGDSLPTVRELAGRLVVNPNTVARAYRELELAGLVESNTRRGTIVKFSPPPIISSERKKRLQPLIEELIAEARVLGFSDEELKERIGETLRKYGDFRKEQGVIKK